MGNLFSCCFGGGVTERRGRTGRSAQYSFSSYGSASSSFVPASTFTYNPPSSYSGQSQTTGVMNSSFYYQHGLRQIQESNSGHSGIGTQTSKSTIPTSSNYKLGPTTSTKASGIGNLQSQTRLSHGSRRVGGVVGSSTSTHVALNTNRGLTTANIVPVPRSTSTATSVSIKQARVNAGNAKKKVPSLNAASSKKGTRFVPKNPPAPRASREEGRNSYNYAIRTLSGLISASERDLKSWLRYAQILERGTMPYEIIATYVNNGQAHSDFGVEIISIMKIVRRNATEFIKRDGYNSRESNRFLLWHGTRLGNVTPILKNGFKLPKNSTGLVQGEGIYFADRVSKSVNYCDCRIMGTAYLFLCDVAIGNKKTINGANHDFKSAPTGYKSVKTPGKKIPRPGCGMRFEGSYILLGETVDSDIAGNNLEYNEYTVYDPDQIFIKYLVYFRLTPSPFNNPI